MNLFSKKKQQAIEPSPFIQVIIDWDKIQTVDDLKRIWQALPGSDGMITIERKHKESIEHLLYKRG